jgi:hypothetical protein
MATVKEIMDANLNGHGHVVYEAAKNAGFEMTLNEEGRLDLADACALVDHESAGGQNIFGCDFGSQWTWEPPYCNVPVTAERVQALLRNIDAGGGQNGVGLTQLTTVGFVREAEQRGGAHLPEHQCSVGFEYLKSLVDDLGYMYGIAAYNAGPGNAALGISNGYYGKIQAQREKWKQLFAGTEIEGDVSPPVGTPGILTAEAGTNFRKGLDYVLPIIGLRDYVAAYAGGVFGPGYFEGYAEPFDLQQAKRWARETRCGVLLLRPYWNASLSGQGHVAILLPSGYVLQSFPNMLGPDLNWDYTIEESNAGDYYYEMVHPSNWSEYEGDEF